MGRTIYPFAHIPASQVFTTSGTFVVPSNLVGDSIFITGVAAGGGGCSGGAVWNLGAATPNDDYANGGASGQSCVRLPLVVTAGESLTVNIGAPGAGGAAVNRTTSGTTNGNDGADGTGSDIRRGSVVIVALWAGGGATWATGGGGAAEQPNAADSVTNGADGGDNVTAAVHVGTQLSGTEGTDDGTTLGGHAGSASAYGWGGNGGNGDAATGADATGTDGTDGGYGGGGGGGGNASASTATGFAATSGAGGDGGPAFLLIEWLQES